MSVVVEKLESNMAKLTVTVPAEEFEQAVQKVYLKEKNRINIPGFRKGKAPRQVIEKMYGKEVFFEGAANEIIPSAYEKAYDECGEDIVSTPKIEVTAMEAGKDFVFTAEVALRPEVTLGEYKGLEAEKLDVNVSDEDVEAELSKERERSARSVSVTDRAVADKDEIILDFEGFVDGVAFQGGKGENYPLTIGSGQFIPGFEEQLIGKNLNEECDINVTFPEDYSADDLKGKAAVFKCTVKEIKERILPELDDEFAAEVSEFDTLAEYREDIKKKLFDKKEAEAKTAREDALVQKVVDNSTMDIPDAMASTEANNMVREFANRIQMQGFSFDQYLQMTGATRASMEEQFKPKAIERIKTGLVLKAIVDKEGISASEEEYADKLKEMAETYRMSVEDLEKSFGDEGRNSIMNDIAINKAVDLVVSSSKEK